jgi:hypothetical protein
MLGVGDGEDLPLDLVLGIHSRVPLIFRLFPIVNRLLLTSLLEGEGMSDDRSYDAPALVCPDALLVAVDLGCLVTLFKRPSLLIVFDELVTLIAIQAHRP